MTGALYRRRQLARAVAGLAALGLLAFGWLGWRVMAARPAADLVAAQGLHVANLAPGRYRWAEAPALPRGAQLPEGASLHVLLLRLPDGALHAFYATAVEGRPALPADGGHLGAAGLPCADFAPDFARQDIACRQAAPGFEFALRHRWSLTGQPLTPNTPPLPVAAGHETGGQWLPDLAAQAALP